MDFSLTDEQTLLQDSMERFIQNDYTFDARQKLIKEEPGFGVDNWKTFAELGWLAMPFAETDGGFGGTAVETMLMQEQLGKGLVVEPFLATVVLTGGAIALAGDAKQKERFLPGIIDGSQQGALAYAEPQGRFNLSNLTTTASKSGAGYSLSGQKSVVINGPSANLLVVSARTSGDQMDEAGVSLFVVPADSAGISRRDYPTVDGLRASEVTFDNVAVGEEGSAG